MPSAPLSWVSLNITTEEDFDFDDAGFALVQDGSALIGRDQFGGIKIVSSNVSTDVAGIQVLSNGDIAVVGQDEGAIRRVDVLTGAAVTIVSGLTQPNGLEIGSGDRIYFTEFTAAGKVRWFDPNTLTDGVILADSNNPNGLVLSNDEQTLYIGGNRSAGNPAVLAVDRIGPDEWETEPYVVFEDGGGNNFDAVEMDLCGNLYTVEYDDGQVIRIPGDGGEPEVVAQLTDSAGWSPFNSARWGNGVGGWERDILYITNRKELFAVEVGIPGKPSPSAVLGWPQ
jgi:sugar lactone lactonase YvrE